MRLLVTLSIVLTLAFVVYDVFDIGRMPRACSSPINYSIGIFDKRFNISQTNFLKAVSEAEAVWEKQIGKDLFTYDPKKDDLKINLIYDYRQETTNKLANIETVVSQDEDTYNALRQKYLTLKSEYEKMNSLYENEANVFDEKNRNYEKMVDDWNRGPRNSKEQFERLESERKSLVEDAARLNAKEVEINNKALEININVDTLNQLAKSLNLTVEKYNTIGSARGESFTGGTYYSGDKAGTIDIYEFSTRDKLVRILAHELGHALGLDHIDDPEAIMYFLNEGDNESLTQDDLAALRQLCGV